MKNLRIPIAVGVVLLILFAAFTFMREQTPMVRTAPSQKAQRQQQLLITGKRVLKLCPKPSTLRYTQLKWIAPGGWKSVDKPLSRKIGRFKKAQWQGVNLGEVICQYESGQGSAFPVELQRLAGKVVYEPNTIDWKKTAPGVKTCFSVRVNTCPFYERKLPPKKSYPQLYREIFIDLKNK